MLREKPEQAALGQDDTRAYKLSLVKGLESNKHMTILSSGF